MTVGRLHQFSPQRTAPEDLEAILVAREPLLAGTLAKIHNSARTKNKHHRLFVGQRGIGKTHLLALINHRVARDESIEPLIRIAWLNEDETSSRFLHLLIRIYRSLSARYPEEYPADDLNSIIGQDADDALEQLSASLLRRTGKRTILLLIENLDAHFAKFSIEEQRRWRGFLQDHPIFTTVATAQRLFDGISKQDEPFFGFFDTHHLQPLTVDQTADMLARIAALEHDDRMQRVLQTEKGRSRLRVVHYLAGGNPRLYVLLAELITEESLDDVVQTFETMVDRQLTSYYQERLRWLAPLQQDIVQVLCRHRPAVSVKEMAEELFTTNQSISGQLKELRSFGYVRSTKDGRETRYELAEPLMRLVMQVKETSSRQPLRLLVEFLQAWFEEAELRRRLGYHARNSPGRKYLEAAVQSYSAFYESWPELRDRPETDGTIDGYTTIIESPDSTSAEIAKALIDRGFTHGQQGDVDREIADYTAVIERDDAPVDQIARALVNRGVAHGQQGDVDRTIADFTAVIERDDAPVDQIAWALFNRGVTHGQQGDVDRAIADYTAVIERADAPVDQIAMALVNRGVAYDQQGDADREIADYTTVIEMNDAPADQIAIALCYRGYTYGQQGDADRMIADYTTVVEMNDAPVDLVAAALVKRGAALVRCRKASQAVLDLEHTLGLDHAYLRMAGKRDTRGFCDDLLAIVLATAQTDRSRLAQRLMTRAADIEIEEQLGQALVRQLKVLRELSLDAVELSAWNRLWQEVALGIESLIVPLRLLSAGIDYLVTQKDTSLLDLPLEERRIVREALGLDAE